MPFGERNGLKMKKILSVLLIITLMLGTLTYAFAENMEIELPYEHETCSSYGHVCHISEHEEFLSTSELNCRRCNLRNWRIHSITGTHHIISCITTGCRYRDAVFEGRHIWVPRGDGGAQCGICGVGGMRMAE